MSNREALAIDQDTPAGDSGGSPLVTWKKSMLRVHDKDDLDCTDACVLMIGDRVVLRAIVPSHGLGDPVSDADRELIGKALSAYLATKSYE